MRWTDRLQIGTALSWHVGLSMGRGGNLPRFIFQLHFRSVLILGELYGQRGSGGITFRDPSLMVKEQ